MHNCLTEIHYNPIGNLFTFITKHFKTRLFCLLRQTICG